MFVFRFLLVVASCLVLTVASPLHQEDFYELQNPGLQGYDAVLSRHARSPQGGRVGIGYSKDQYGREASVQYNHNLYTSKDGRGSIEAYGQASRNFDHNRNNYGGGIQGRWRF